MKSIVFHICCDVFYLYIYTFHLVKMNDSYSIEVHHASVTRSTTKIISPFMRCRIRIRILIGIQIRKERRQWRILGGGRESLHPPKTVQESCDVLID